MQVGFFFWPYNLDLCEKLAERADRYGYAMIGIADTPGNAMDPWVSAAMVARASQRTRVALCVTNLLTRHPAVSAAAIASLDHVSNGRAVLGIGAGHSGTKNVGLPKSRAKELAEGVTFIKTLAEGRAGHARHGERTSAVDQARAAGLSRRLASQAAAGRRADRRRRVRQLRPGGREYQGFGSAHLRRREGRGSLAGRDRDLADRSARLQSRIAMPRARK